jgi:hypothetical protein
MQHIRPSLTAQTTTLLQQQQLVHHFMPAHPSALHLPSSSSSSSMLLQSKVPGRSTRHGASSNSSSMPCSPATWRPWVVLVHSGLMLLLVLLLVRGMYTPAPV